MDVSVTLQGEHSTQKKISQAGCENKNLHCILKTNKNKQKSWNLNT